LIDFKEELISLLKQHIDSLTHEEIEKLIEIPPSYDMGDFAFPVFKLAKEYKKST
jgi:arginyl-tRNA synthetase (EC 6.1.1.19)